MNPDTLKSWKEAVTTLPPRGADSGNCPEPERIWSAVRGELPPDEFGCITDHAAGCPLCALAWDLAEQGSDAVGRPQVPQTGRPWRVWYGLAAAAVLVMAAALVLQFGGSGLVPPGAEPQYRAPVDQAVLPGLQDGATLSRDDCTLQWSGPAGAVFNLQVADAGFHTLLRETGLAEGSFTVPAETLAGLPSGGEILWQVEAVLPDGTVQRSRTFRATVE